MSEGKHTPTPWKLSERLRNRRADQPDEWAMDEYAKRAEELESINDLLVKMFKKIIIYTLDREPESNNQLMDCIHDRATEALKAAGEEV